MIQILVVDDHALMREGIVSALADEPDMAVVAQAQDGRSAIEQFRQHTPDVTLMDVQLPDITGIDALRVIRAGCPRARVIMLTTYRGDAHVRSALHHGAVGFLLKTALRKDLKEAVRKAHAGSLAISADVALELAENMAADQLTPRELEVLQKASTGMTNRAIAGALNVSEDTVKAHMKNAFAKLGARDRTHAVVVAMKRGIINVSD